MIMKFIKWILKTIKNILMYVIMFCAVISMIIPALLFLICLYGAQPTMCNEFIKQLKLKLKN